MFHEKTMEQLLFFLKSVKASNARTCPATYIFIFKLRCLLNLDRLKVNDPMRQIARALFFTVGMRGWIDWIVKKLTIQSAKLPAPYFS